MRILCRYYSVTIPNEDVVRIILNHTIQYDNRGKAEYTHIVINTVENIKTDYFDASEGYPIDKISENKWAIELRDISEIRMSDD